jgi:hypothetical protein
MAITSLDLLDYLYHRCLPEIYREEDLKLGRPLYRYLQSLILGGHEWNIQDIENIITLVNPETCPAEFFPILYESFGLTYYPDVDIKYHRKFLMNFGELRRRRGTYSCIRYLVRVLTGLDVELSYLRGEYLGEQGRHLILNLKATSIMEILNLDNSVALVQKFLGLFLPYYITTHTIGSIATVYLTHSRIWGGAVSEKKSYTVRPRKVVKSLTRKVNRANAVVSTTYYKINNGGE